MKHDVYKAEDSNKDVHKLLSRKKQRPLNTLMNDNDIASLISKLNIINNAALEAKTRKTAKRYMNDIRSGYITIAKLESIKTFVTSFKGPIQSLIESKPIKKGKRVKSYLKINHKMSFKTKRKYKNKSVKPKRKSKSEYTKEAEKERRAIEYEDDEPPKPIVVNESIDDDDDDDVIHKEYKDDTSSDSDSEEEEETFEIKEWEFMQKTYNKGIKGAPHYEMAFYVSDYGSIEKTLRAIINTLNTLEEEIKLGTHTYYIELCFTGIFHTKSCKPQIRLNSEMYSSDTQSKAKAVIEMLKNSLKEMNVNDKTSVNDFYTINNLTQIHRYEEMSSNSFNLGNFKGAIIKRYVNISEKARLNDITSKTHSIHGRTFEFNEKERAYVPKQRDRNAGFFNHLFNKEKYINTEEAMNTLIEILHTLQIYTSAEDMYECKNYKITCFTNAIIEAIKHEYPNTKTSKLNQLRTSLMIKQITKRVNVSEMSDVLEELSISMNVNVIDIDDITKLYSKASNPKRRTVNNKKVSYFGCEPKKAKYKITTFIIDKHMIADYKLNKNDLDVINCETLKLKGRGISSVSTGMLVYKMFVNDMFKEIDLSTYNILRSVNHEEVSQNITSLIIDDTTLKSYKDIYDKRLNSSKKKHQVTRLWYADFEAFTNRFTTGVHEAFMICFCNKTSEIYTVVGRECASALLDHIVNDTNKYIYNYEANMNESIDVETIVYFHNLSYDLNFLAHLGIKGSINNGTNYFTATIQHKGHVIHFRDSLKLIPCKLERFPSMFKLECGQKEVFPYDLYNEERLYEGKRWSIEKADAFEKEQWTKSKKDQFRKNVESIQGCKNEDDNTFDLYTYAKFYCEQDVRILREGLIKFDDMCEKALGIKATSKLSVSSLANAYLELNVYSKIKDDLYFLGGSLMLYAKKYINGGRTMCAYNKAWIMNDAKTPLVDFDAVSLYPSAMNRLEIQGGKPETISINDDMKDNVYDCVPDILKCYNSYLIEIDIVHVGVHYAFPMILKRGTTSEGNNYEDINIDTEHVCHQYVDNYKLEDLIKYHRIKFKIRSESLENNVIGLGWKGSKYDVLKPCIQKLFNERLKYKAEGNPLQEVLKLIMNSIYGKMIESEHIFNYVYKRDESIQNKDGSYKNQFINYISKNNYKVIEYTSLIDINGDESPIKCIKVVSPIHKCFRNMLTGIQVLSMSKRVINEVTCTAHDNEIPMFYTDTDSMHLFYNDLQKLANVYEERFKRPLIGKQLGQFHSDFPVFGTSNEMPLSIYSNFVSKKFYIDILKNDHDEYFPFVRCKGIPNDCIKNYVMEHYNKGNINEGREPISMDDFDLCLNNEYTPFSKDICDMYKRYYEDLTLNGLKAEYNLAAKHLKLKKTLALQIQTLNAFPRTVRSRYNKGDIKSFFNH